MEMFVVLSVAFIVTVAVVLALERWAAKRRRVIEERMQMVVQPRSDETPLAAELFARRTAHEGALFERLLRRAALRRWVALKMLRAGLPLQPSEFVAIMVTFTAGGFFMGAVVLDSGLDAFGLAAAGFLLPIWFVNQRAARRKSALERQLIHALKIMSASLRVGRSLLQGLQSASQEMPSPIAEEMRQAVNQIQRGLPMEEALSEMAERVGSYDFDMFVTATVTQLRTGGRIADLLDTIADTIRERLMLEREIKAATAQAKLSAVILILLPPFIGGMLMLINPGYIRLLLDHPMGQGMVKLAIAMQVMGILVMRKIVSVRV